MCWDGAEGSASLGLLKDNSSLDGLASATCTGTWCQSVSGVQYVRYIRQARVFLQRLFVLPPRIENKAYMV